MESKFINSETIEYVKSLNEQTTTQVVAEVSEKLSETLDYLGDFEKWVDATQKETDQRVRDIADSVNRDHVELRGQLRMLQRQVTRQIRSAVIISSIAILIVGGLLVWLTK